MASQTDPQTGGDRARHSSGSSPGRLTIVSRPLAAFSSKTLARKVVEKLTGRERYATHRALMQYTLDGLRKLGHRPIYDPVMRSGCSEHVVLMGFDENIPWAVRARQSGRLKYLAMGPPMANAVRKELLRYVPIQSYIDNIFMPSDYYLTRCCEEAPELAHLYAVWSCGVDTDYWTPAPRGGARPRVVVYQKNAPDETFKHVLEVLSRLPVEPRVLMYGSYVPVQFRQALQGAACAVILSRWESQGIAMAEAWACDVPTFNWRDGPNATRPYSAPLLTSSTGSFFHDPEELPDLIAGAQRGGTYQPREWVLKNLTDKGQASELLRLCGLAVPQQR